MGTLNFVSYHVMKGYKPTRRDDIISLAYMILYLLNDSPIDPVINKNLSIEANFNTVMNFKEKLTVDEMCKSEVSKPLRPLFEEIFSYGFADEPFYSKLRHMLTVLLLDQGKTPQQNVIVPYDQNTTQFKIGGNRSFVNHEESIDEKEHKVAEEETELRLERYR